MRYTCLVLLAVLAFSLPSVRAADTLSVDITVSLTVPLNVVYLDSSSTKSWALSGKSLNSNYDSTLDNPININLQNNSGVDVSISAQVTSQGNWLLEQQTGASSAKDKFWITATPALELTGTAQSFVNTLATGTSTSSNKLILHTPSSVSTVNSGIITVQFVATAK